MREVAETKTRKMPAGASRVVEVMETMNLPQLHKEWTVEGFSQGEENDCMHGLQIHQGCNVQ